MPKYSAERLRAARPAGMSREQAARLVGKSTWTLVHYEQGTVTPTVRALGDLARIYAVGVETLFDPDDPDDDVARFSAELRALVDAAPPLSARQRVALRQALRGVS